MATVLEPGTDRPIGTQYGCQRCRTAFTVINGFSAACGDRAMDLIKHIERGKGAPEKREIPVQRDMDMPWGRR